MLDVTYENGQARVRTLVLMDLANRTGGLVVGTGDLLRAGPGLGHLQRRPHVHVRRQRRRAQRRWCAIWCGTRPTSPRPKRCKTVLLDILDTPVIPGAAARQGRARSPRRRKIWWAPMSFTTFFLYHMLRFGFRPAKIYRLA